MRNLILAVLGLTLLQSGCEARQAVPSPTIAPTLTAPPTSTFTHVPDTPAALPTHTPARTPVPFPMSIAALRLGTYPGSDIVIEEELTRGANYHRYYAYYLSEGLKIYALLTVPNGAPPDTCTALRSVQCRQGGWPAIVFNHGYIPPDVYRTTERYIAYVDELARAGYVVFRIDYRGNDASEGEATGAYGSPGYTVDVLNAVASIKRYPGVNPERIGMWGHSMGGFLTLRAMVISKDVKAGVIWAGVVASYPDLLYNWPRPAGVNPSPSSRGRGWRTEWIQQFGTPEQNPEFWASVSADTYVADLSGPLQLHHGTADEDVPPAFSIRLAEEVRAAGGIADLYEYEGDNHNISKYFSLAMERTIEFFDEYLK